MPQDAASIRFRIDGTDLYYTVPEGVVNPPVFSMRDGALMLVSRGFFPEEAIFHIERGQMIVTYDLSDYTPEELSVFKGVRRALGIQPNDLTLDSYILFYLKGVERFILNYCALGKVPEALWYVWVEMVSAKVQANKNGFAAFENASPSTVKDGAQSVSYSNSPSASVAGLSSEEREQFLNGWGHQLRQFRRFKWG